MNSTEINTLHNFMNKREMDLLNRKASEYSTDADRLINFKETAELMQTTTERACWNLATKHLQSIRKLLDEEFTTEEYILEKIGDIRNYMLLLAAILYEKHSINLLIKYEDNINKLN